MFSTAPRREDEEVKSSCGLLHQLSWVGLRLSADTESPENPGKGTQQGYVKRLKSLLRDESCEMNIIDTHVWIIQYHSCSSSPSVDPLCLWVAYAALYATGSRARQIRRIEGSRQQALVES